MTHLKAQASNEVTEQNTMALWKGLPVLTRRDDHPRECQEIGLVALIFFFELLFSYVSLAISLYVFLTNLFSLILSLSANYPRHSRQRRSKI